MKSKTLLTVILSIVLVSCTPKPASTPTETLVPTGTKAVTPILHTPTVTPEPYPTPTPMELESKTVFEYESGEVAVNEFTQIYTSESGKSWDVLRDDVLDGKNPNFEEYKNRGHDGWNHYAIAREQVFCFDVVRLHLPFMGDNENYIVAPSAASRADEVALILLAKEADGRYIPIATHFDETGETFTSFEDLREAFADGIHAFEFVHYVRDPHRINQIYEELKLDTDNYYYDQQILKRGDNLEDFMRLLDDWDAAPWKSVNYDWSRLPDEIGPNYNGVVAELVFMFEDLVMEKVFIIPNVALH